MPFEFSFAAYFFLDSIKLFVYEFKNVSAVQTNQMIVSRSAESLLETGVVFSEAILRDQSALNKQVKSIIDGCARSFQTFHRQNFMKLIGVKVSICSHDLIEEKETFAGGAKLLFLEVGGESLSCCFDVQWGKFNLDLVQI